ncbi:carboxypeptidase-like regulatory domain-containing protein [Mediterranea massiliensis]|uniref:carboxypeptidase-like regulatory domain-containing protein n=1 Tax=Mediterranea massiliensis TaxID=1841865 RepID=UPI001114F52B|nr:carboxypeptidase-like regulatory domain-containing protein [Mediterranea massiliensis]
MKTSKFLVMALLLAATGMGMGACSDDEKTPEQVEDPITSNVEYYIEGVVSDGNAGVEGVTVSTTGYDAVTTKADGTFQLIVDKASEYTVEFAKDGYLNTTATANLTGLTNRSGVAITINMTQKAEAVAIPANANVIIEPEKVTEASNDEAISDIEEIGAYIPNEAVGEGTKVSMTSYIPESNISSTTQGNVSSSVSAIYVETSNGEITATEENPIILAVNNPSNTETRFSKMTVYKVGTTATRANNLQSLGDATYDAATNSYQLVLTSGKLEGSYEFHVNSNRTLGQKGTEVLNEGTVDNSGSYEAMNNIPLTYEARMGWSFNATIDSELASLIKKAIESNEGSENMFTVSRNLTTNLGGRSILYWKAVGNYQNISYTFQLNTGNYTVELTKYTGVDFSYVVVDANEHSGGTSGSDM